METHHSTTPFGRRPLSLGMVASQIAAQECAGGTNVHKWQIFRALCEGKGSLGVSERALAVLNALLSFYPETELSAERELIVFPSNAQLSLRAHGMAPATLRRHLAVLVDRGLVVRRDSPNGKRFARKGQGGTIEQAFGFDLRPLVARAAEIEAYAEAARVERRTLTLTREAITLLRRDISKMISTGIEEGVAHDWRAAHAAFTTIIQQIPRTARACELSPIVQELTALSLDIRKTLENHLNSQNLSGNESQNERHIQNSNPNSSSESEPSFRKSSEGDAELNPAGSRLPETDRGGGEKGGRSSSAAVRSNARPAKHEGGGIEPSAAVKPVPAEPGPNLARSTLPSANPGAAFTQSRSREETAHVLAVAAASRASGESRDEAGLRSYPLGLVLQACPDITMYAKTEISSWRDLMSTAVLVRSMLGISPSAYEDACHVMGPENAAVVVAAILQRSNLISSPGGYLRSLTAKARSGQFSLGPVLMALLRAQNQDRRSA